MILDIRHGERSFFHRRHRHPIGTEDMDKKTAASAATDACNLFSEPARNAKAVLQKRLATLVGRYSDSGDWLGGLEDSEEVAQLTAAIQAIDEAEMVEVHADGIVYPDIELPSGKTFTARLDADLADELQRCLDRLKPTAVVEGIDPEATAREEYARQDKARGIDGRLWAFAVDPYKCSREELRLMEVTISLALKRKNLEGKLA
jgi:hypothetical protein